MAHRFRVGADSIIFCEACGVRSNSTSASMPCPHATATASAPLPSPAPAQSNSKYSRIMTRVAVACHSFIILDALYFFVRFPPGITGGYLYLTSFQNVNPHTGLDVILQTASFDLSFSDWTGYVTIGALKVFSLVTWLIDTKMATKRDPGWRWRTAFFPFSLFPTNLELDDFEKYRYVRFFAVAIPRIAISMYLVFGTTTFTFDSSAWAELWTQGRGCDSTNNLYIQCTYNQVNCNTFQHVQCVHVGVKYPCCYYSSIEGYAVGGVLLLLSVLQAWRDFMLFLVGIQNAANSRVATTASTVTVVMTQPLDVQQQPSPIYTDGETSSE